MAYYGSKNNGHDLGEANIICRMECARRCRQKRAKQQGGIFHNKHRHPHSFLWAFFRWKLPLFHPSHYLHLPHGRFINGKASHQRALFANNKRHSQHMEPGSHREQIFRKHFNRILIQIPNKQQMNDKMINHLINDNTQDLTVCLFAFSSDKTLTMCANWFYPKCQMIAFQFHELRNVSALWN